MTTETIGTAIILRDPKVLALIDEVQKILTAAELRVIASDNDLPGATNDLALIKGVKKAVAEKQREYTAPLNQHLKDISTAFTVLTTPLDEADRLTRDKVMAYRTAQLKAKADEAEINRLRTEAAEKEMKLKGELSESVNLVPEREAPIRRVVTAAADVGTVRLTKYEVVNFYALPDEYKIINHALLGPVVRASKGNLVIPGVRIYTEETLAVRGR